MVKKCHCIERNLLRVDCHLSFDSKKHEKRPHFVGTCGFKMLPANEADIANDPFHVGLMRVTTQAHVIAQGFEQGAGHEK